MTVSKEISAARKFGTSKPNPYAKGERHQEKRQQRQGLSGTAFLCK